MKFMVKFGTKKPNALFGFGGLHKPDKDNG